MKIHIFYRHFNISGNDFKGRPEWFNFEKCFLNLLSSIENKDATLHLVMDGDVTTNFINKFADKYTLHSIKAGEDQSSFWQTWKIVKEQDIPEGDLIYFLENDYLHTDDWVDKTVEIFKTFSGLNYISLYDHNDKYFLPVYEELASKIFTTPSHHWRTTPSTCGSFIIPKNIFEEDYKEHTEIRGDHNKFLHLAETKGRFILSPLPGLSTHCMNGLLSPTINWSTI
tara:strand:- start:156 stop:833 length:678 start_codon:yes stop_codon:yes gene_type:complete